MCCVLLSICACVLFAVCLSCVVCMPSSEEYVVCFYIDEVQHADGSVELFTVTAQSASAPLFSSNPVIMLKSPPSIQR
jgi:hypothetical protein